MRSGRIFAAVLCLGATGLASAHPVVTLVQTFNSTPAQGATAKPVSSEYPVRVTLGRKYVAVDAQDTRRIYDFEHRRVYQLNLKDKTYREAALYSVVAGKQLEAQNRMNLGSVLGAAKAQQPSFEVPQIEHQFSVTIEEDGAKIDTARAKGMTTFSWKGREWASISDSTKPLPADAQREYWQWLRYSLGGHPKIYAGLDKRKGVPDQFRIVFSDPGEQVTTLKLTSVADEPDAPFSLQGFTRSELNREPFRTLKKVSSDPAGALKAATEKAKKDRDAAAAEGKLLDAALAHFTYALSTGDSDNGWLTGIKERMEKDPGAEMFAASLSAEDDEHAQRAIQRLQLLRTRTSSPYAYLIDVFAANHEGSLKHGTASEKLFLGALNANPYLTGAWFDLGKLYYRTAKTREAWACWDIARAMNPDHPFAKEINTLERRMAEDSPEFF
jgi:hypothetical protein